MSLFVMMSMLWEWFAGFLQWLKCQLVQPPPQRIQEDVSSIRPKLTVLFGSQTGTAEGFAKRLVHQALCRGYDSECLEMDEFEDASMEGPLIFVVATHGEGEPTDNARAFYAAKVSRFAGRSFAVFALGDTRYKHFCYMGHWVQRHLEESGGQQLCLLGQGDANKGTTEDAFDEWCQVLWGKLCHELLEDKDDAKGFEWLPQDDVVDEQSLTDTECHLRTRYKNHELSTCSVEKVYELCQSKGDSIININVKHIVLSGTPSYEAADTLYVHCDNGSEAARELARRLGVEPHAKFSLSNGATMYPSCTVETALRSFADLQAPVSRDLLAYLAKHCNSEEEARQLQKASRNWGLAALLQEHPSCHPPFSGILQRVATLAPRSYTIASAPEVVGSSQMHITVKVLEEPWHGFPERTKKGLCSNFLATQTEGDRVMVSVRASTFRLPPDKGVPMIMICAGTGIAPFRAMIQKLRKEPMQRTSVLYFGCRHPDVDSLYHDEFSEAIEHGCLSRLQIAHSRCSPRQYVQELLLEDASQLRDLVHLEGAYIYVCGGVTMGNDVAKVLDQTLPMTTTQLMSSGRYVTELW